MWLQRQSCSARHQVIQSTQTTHDALQAWLNQHDVGGQKRADWGIFANVTPVADRSHPRYHSSCEFGGQIGEAVLDVGCDCSSQTSWLELMCDVKS